MRKKFDWKLFFSVFMYIGIEDVISRDTTLFRPGIVGECRCLLADG